MKMKKNKNANAKTVIFVRYINAGCQVFTFSGMRNACRFVNKNFDSRCIPFSNNNKKHYSAKIKASIREGIAYCGGQWIIVE